jgi:putative tryptophan/tyrosine transport system substrate-binding protein
MASRSAALWPANIAQAQEKTLEIGVLALGPRSVPAWRCGQEVPQPGEQGSRHETMPHYVLGLLDWLEKLKYVEAGPDGKPKKASAGSGRRFAIDLRMGTAEELKSAARDFARKRVDIIVGVATLAVGIAQQETRGSQIPILMTGVSEPVTEGFVESLARPGGVITGVSHQLLQGSGKRVELFKEIVPGLRRLISMRMPSYSVSEKSVPETRAAAHRFNMKVVDYTVATRKELQTVLSELQPDRGDGILVSPDSLILSNVDLIIEYSLSHRIAAFAPMTHMVEWGILAAYGPSAFQAGAHVARYVDKISKGAKPGDMPVEPIDPTFVINLKAAKCLGVSIPLQVLQQADQVIQ